jgi:hypothetical protein
MVMSQHHEKGSPNPALVPRGSGDRSSWQPPLQFDQCSRCDEHRCQADGLKDAGPLVLTLGPLGSAADGPCRCCSCAAVAAPGPTPETVAVLRGSRYLRPAQELLSEAVRVADDDLAGDGEEAETQERVEAGVHRAMRRAAVRSDAEGVQAKLLGLLSEVVQFFVTHCCCAASESRSLVLHRCLLEIPVPLA